MSLPGVYLDEDAQSWALIETLRARGLAVVTTTEVEMSKRTDEEQLRFALSRDLVLITFNVADFARLHSEWMKAGVEHSGIILIHQQRWGVGELARRIIRLLASVPGRDMRNRLEFIGNW